MSEPITRKRTGVVAECQGLFWGVAHDDGHSKSFAYGPIEQAVIADPRYCRSAVDLAYTGSPYAQSLERGRLLPITITTTYEVGE